MKDFFIPAFIAFILVFSVTPLIKDLAMFLGLVDDPEKSKHPAKIHIRPIPRAGGVAIFLGVCISSILFLTINKAVWGILLGGMILVIVGIWDDKKNLNPYFRFLTNLLAASLVVAGGVGIPYLTNPFNGIVDLSTIKINFNFFGAHTIWLLADLLAILWIVWCMNIVNWSKGVDGQMPGFVTIAAIILGILSLRFSSHDIAQSDVTILCFITAGAFLGFLPWNIYPQKIMPGYSGGTLAGYLLAVLAILSWGKLGTAILVLGIPMSDAIYTLFRRISSGKSPVWADKGHLHHRLLKAGWSIKKIAAFYWIVSALLGFIALSLGSQGKLFAMVFLLVLVGGFIIWLKAVST